MMAHVPSQKRQWHHRKQRFSFRQDPAMWRMGHSSLLWSWHWQLWKPSCSVWPLLLLEVTISCPTRLSALATSSIPTEDLEWPPPERSKDQYNSLHWKSDRQLENNKRHENRFHKSVLKVVFKVKWGLNVCSWQSGPAQEIWAALNISLWNLDHVSLSWTGLFSLRPPPHTTVFPQS